MSAQKCVPNIHNKIYWKCCSHYCVTFQKEAYSHDPWYTNSIGKQNVVLNSGSLKFAHSI